MNFKLCLLVLFFIHDRCLSAATICVDKVEDWGYVDVRADAHIFWWVYCSTSQHTDDNTPLVLWLQGGPGGSSTGFGNFGEIGPLDVKQQPRNTTWLQEAHLLFIDNPVGVGFSYVTSDDAYTTDVWMIAQDLLTTLKAFMQRNTKFQTAPFFIFSESYGGKMTAAFSKVLHQAIKDGQIACNFKGFAMGDSWISPIDSVLTWGPYLYATSIVDEAGLAKVNASAIATQVAVETGEFKNATSLWSQTEGIIDTVTGGVDFYNILKWDGEGLTISERVRLTNSERVNGTTLRDGDFKEAIARLYHRHVSRMQNDDLSDLMNGPIRKKLGIIPDSVKWGAQSGKVFEKQAGDFMKPVIDVVDELVSTTDLQVVVYSGQLDLIVDTMGTEIWVQKLTWPGLPEYNRAVRKPLREGAAVQAYVKTYKNFSFYWIMDAGHMVPADNGDAALKMLKMVTQ